MTKKKNFIIFIRHGHRDKPLPDADNGLSEKGQKQVEALLKDLKKENLPKSQFFWSSPKRRCQETLKPLSDACGVTMVIEKLLDEQASGELQHQFLMRIENLIEKAKKVNDTIYLCSHGDFIPMAIDMMTGKSVDVRKGEALILSFEKNRWEII